LHRFSGWTEAWAHLHLVWASQSRRDRSTQVDFVKVFRRRIHVQTEENIVKKQLFQCHQTNQGIYTLVFTNIILLYWQISHYSKKFLVFIHFYQRNSCNLKWLSIGEIPRKSIVNTNDTDFVCKMQPIWWVSTKHTSTSEMLVIMHTCILFKGQQMTIQNKLKQIYICTSQ